MKKVLITGANSYIGVSFENYAKKYYSNKLAIDTIDMIDGSWRNKDFSEYDVVYHVAGIAHADVGKVSAEVKAKYYDVNTKLAIETCKKAKKDGVGQFVFMSSAIVYGDSAPIGKRKRITAKTKPRPSNFYGDSKWKADKGVRRLEDDNFIVTVLRPPMIYGKGSKGNYPTLSKMAKMSPVFPDVYNERSMLYIDNLCEFLCQVMIRSKGGIFWPQNKEYTKTSEMVRLIGEASGNKVRISKLLNPGIGIASHIPGKIAGLSNKAFGNLTYDKKMSQYDFDYQLVGLKESIERTEGVISSDLTNRKQSVSFDPDKYMLNDNTSLREYQLKLLDILIYFDSFCREHNLRYYMCGGTCIGAVRHKGFIPWDCDIDVFMPRKDFEIISNIWDKYADVSKYCFDRTNKTNNMRAQLGAVKDVNTTYIRSHNTHYDMNHGMPIDVVVLDHLSNNSIKRKIQALNGVVFSLFNSQREPNQHGEFAKVLSRIIFKVFRSKDIRYKIWTYCEKAMSKYDKYNTKYVGELVTGFHNANLLYPSKWFDEPKELEFEGHNFYGPTCPEEYLEMRYPGFMKLPPESERIPKFTPAFIDLNTSYLEYKGIEYDGSKEDE